MVGGSFNYEGDAEINTDITEEKPTENPEESKREDTASIEKLSEEWKVTASGGLKLREGPGLNYNQVGL